MHRSAALSAHFQGWGQEPARQSFYPTAERRGGGAAERTTLLTWSVERHRGFKSLPLLHLHGGNSRGLCCAAAGTPWVASPRSSERSPRFARHLHRGYALASVYRGASVAETGVPQPSAVG